MTVFESGNAQMNQIDCNSARKHPDVPAFLLQKWQHIVDLLAKLSRTPAVLITQVRQDDISLLLKSCNPQNPFRRKGFNKRHSDMYCDTVINRRKSLFIEDATQTRHWQQSPNVEKGMTFYLGYPLNWPNAEPFGTICLMDQQADNQACHYQHLIEAFQALINHDLKLLEELDSHHQQQQQLESHLALLHVEIDARNVDVAEINTALRVLLRQRESDRQIIETQACAQLSQQLLPLLAEITDDPLTKKQQEKLQQIQQLLNQQQDSRPIDSQLLSATENKVVGFIQQDKSSKEIAEALHVSKKTIDFHRQNIRKKLGLNSTSISLKSYLAPYYPRT